MMPFCSVTTTRNSHKAFILLSRDRWNLVSIPGAAPVFALWQFNILGDVLGGYGNHSQVWAKEEAVDALDKYVSLGFSSPLVPGDNIRFVFNYPAMKKVRKWMRCVTWRICCHQWTFFFYSKNVRTSNCCWWAWPWCRLRKRYVMWCSSCNLRQRKNWQEEQTDSRSAKANTERSERHDSCIRWSHWNAIWRNW